MNREDQVYVWLVTTANEAEENSDQQKKEDIWAIYTGQILFILSRLTSDPSFTIYTSPLVTLRFEVSYRWFDK